MGGIHNLNTHTTGRHLLAGALCCDWTTERFTTRPPGCSAFLKPCGIFQHSCSLSASLLFLSLLHELGVRCSKCAAHSPAVSFSAVQTEKKRKKHVLLVQHTSFTVCQKTRNNFTSTNLEFQQYLIVTDCLLLCHCFYSGVTFKFCL